MEIEIQSKAKNPLLNRTEVHFVIHHEDESTPKRELVRTELADQLKVKKEHVLVDFMRSSFGLRETNGYAKVYSSGEQAKKGERTFILKRNHLIGGEPKKEPEKKPAEEKPAEQKPASDDEKPTETTPSEEPSKDESSKTSSEEKPEEESAKPPAEEPAKETPSEQESEQAKPASKEEKETGKEEKKE